MWRQFLARLNGELSQCGVVDVLGDGGSSIAPIPPRGVRMNCVFSMPPPREDEVGCARVRFL
jgi:hypothetical protein